MSAYQILSDTFFVFGETFALFICFRWKTLTSSANRLIRLQNLHTPFIVISQYIAKIDSEEDDEMSYENNRQGISGQLKRTCWYFLVSDAVLPNAMP